MGILHIRQATVARFTRGAAFTSMLLASAAVSPAFAAPVTFAFEAEITSYTDPDHVLPPGAIYVGEVFSGQYVFESTTPDFFAVPSIGQYSDHAPPSGIQFSISPYGLLFRTDPSNVSTQITVEDGLGTLADRYSYASYNNLPTGPGEFTEGIFIVLNDVTGTAFSSDVLPLTPLDLSLFTQTIGLQVDGHGFITDFGTPRYQFHAKLRSLTLVTPDPDPVPMPEPTSAVLVLSGLALIARRRHARVRAMRWE